MQKNNIGFILSTPRSGSTLLSAILDGHSSIHVPNEPWLLLALSTLWSDSSTHPYSTYRHDQTLTLEAMRKFISQEQFYAASREFATTAYNAVLKENNKNFLIDKTPRYYHALHMLKALFPSSKKIWLKRNPLDVAASYLTTWGITPEQLTGEPFSTWSLDLTLGFKSLSEFADLKDNILEINYEDLVINSNQVIEEVCTHLGVKCEKNILNYSKSKSIASNTEYSMGDKKILNYSTPHTNSIRSYEKTLNRDQIQRLINYIGEEVFQRMGYQETIFELKSQGYKFPPQKDVDNLYYEILEKEKAIQSNLLKQEHHYNFSQLIALHNESRKQIMDIKNELDGCRNELDGCRNELDGCRNEILRLNYELNESINHSFKLQNKKWVKFGTRLGICKINKN
jgi:Sulfotransferase family